MTQPSADAIRWIALVAATALVSVLFVDMIQPFLVALVLAAITSDMAASLQNRMRALTGQRVGLAAALTLLILSAGIVAPLLIVSVLAAQQVQDMTEGAQALDEDLARELEDLRQKHAAREAQRGIGKDESD